MRRDIVLFGLILCIGCDDDLTGPVMPDLTGEWSYSATNLRAPGSPGGVSCNVSDVTLSITQTGERITGTYSGGAVTCSNGLSYSFPRDPYRSLTGSISVSEWDGFALVHFDLDQPYDWSHRGTVSGSSMGGGVSMWGPEFCDEWGCREELLMSGDWMATGLR